jgi:uncharacterized protein DUF6151
MTEAASDIRLHCQCGHVRGVAKDVSPQDGFRFICYCKDCQAFAHFLGRPDVLDAAGGTDIFHMPTGRVALDAGADAVRCLQFSRRVLRWYTECCKTPIANTAAGPGFPVCGLIHSLMDHDADGRSRDAALGRPACRIFERSATAPLPPNAPPPYSLRLVASRVPTLLGWWLRGLGRPNPFFDAQTNTPLAAPRVFTSSERSALGN